MQKLPAGDYSRVAAIGDGSGIEPRGKKVDLNSFEDTEGKPKIHKMKRNVEKRRSGGGQMPRRRRRPIV